MFCDFVAGYEGNLTPHHKPQYQLINFSYTLYSIVVWDIQKDDGINKSKYLDDTSHNSMYIYGYVYFTMKLCKYAYVHMYVLIGHWKHA